MQAGKRNDCKCKSRRAEERRVGRKRRVSFFWNRTNSKWEERNKNQNQKKKAVEKASQKAKRESRKEGLNPKLEPDGEFAEAP